MKAYQIPPLFREFAGQETQEVLSNLRMGVFFHLHSIRGGFA
jgi:hypothetical protein